MGGVCNVVTLSLAYEALQLPAPFLIDVCIVQSKALSQLQWERI